MSTQSNQYILMGIRIPYVNDTFEKYEDYCDSPYEGIKHHNGLCVLYDGRDGNYILIGRVLVKSKEGEDILGPIDLIALWNNYQAENRELLAGLIEARFPDINPLPKLSMYFVTALV